MWLLLFSYILSAPKDLSLDQQRHAKLTWSGPSSTMTQFNWWWCFAVCSVEQHEKASGEKYKSDKILLEYYLLRGPLRSMYPLLYQGIGYNILDGRYNNHYNLATVLSVPHRTVTGRTALLSNWIDFLKFNSFRPPNQRVHGQPAEWTWNIYHRLSHLTAIQVILLNMPQ